jgi:hypothetical protein
MYEKELHYFVAIRHKNIKSGLMISEKFLVCYNLNEFINDENDFGKFASR